MNEFQKSIVSYIYTCLRHAFLQLDGKYVHIPESASAVSVLENKLENIDINERNPVIVRYILAEIQKSATKLAFSIVQF